VTVLNFVYGFLIKTNNCLVKTDRSFHLYKLEYSHITWKKL
jgi:hypothetical protein